MNNVMPGGIDGGVFLGRDETTGRGWPAARIADALGRFGVGRALAVSWRAVWFDAQEGNATTLAEAEKSGGRLLPMAVVNLIGYDPYAGTLARLRQSGFRAAALFPGLIGWSLGRASFPAIAREAAEAGLPLQLCLRDAADLLPAADILARTGAPAMIRWMRGSGYVNIPDILSIARDCPASIFDCGTFTQSGALDHIAQRIGPERMFIASGMPAAHGAAAWFLLAASDLDDEARRMVGGGSLARLLGVDEPAAAPVIGDFVALMAEPKIDTHWHTSGWNVVETRTAFDDLSRTMAKSNLRIAVTSSIRALSDDIEAGNAETESFLDKEPKARGMIVVNPRDLPRSLAQIERYRPDRRFVGVKTIQDFYGLTLDDALYRPILERLAGLPDLPVMAHLPGMKEAAKAHPGVQFIAAHSTWRHRELADLPNVWFDIATSTPLTHESDIADLIAVVGAERVLFSSDAPLMDPAFTLGKLAGLALPREALDAIFRGNALRALPRLRESLDS